MNPANAVNLDEDTLHKEARAWVSRLKTSSLTSRQARELRRWCGRSPSHAAAFAHAREMWDATPQDREQWLREAKLMKKRGHQPLRRALLGGLLVGGGLYLLAKPPLQLWPSLADLRADYRTGAGEQRRVQLMDHVWLDMNTRSRLNVSDDPHLGRVVALLDGEVEVRQSERSASVATVFAGAGSIQTFNGRTNIRYLNGQTQVTCLSGSAQVDVGGQGYRLGAGEQLVYGRHAISSVQTVAAENLPSWRQGRLAFHEQPLSQVLAELNRYWAGHLILRDATLGSVLVSFAVSLDNLPEVLEVLQQVYGVQVMCLPGGIALLSRA
ncbi:FecR domain-containing protein [Alcaligenes aquatilis]|uniref:FecR family protein n=1 Tax=Alcaligenes aquatilis TaxID=323284 RepID=UPI000D52AC69|nr:MULTISPECIES: FecR domain-containing protein [Alcaligenes]AWG36031.1 Fe2+-dicitrate sensor protein [Alcaligenes aquatilis]HBQ88847.1 Fe2+-dicitrate sensor protein [Alcaligenes faecalis]